jgi:hypothetical protein
MTEQQFDARLAEIEREYATGRVGCEARRDQEVSRLFLQCKWTQEAIGKRMGRDQSWVALRLRFGRYLRFMTTGHNHEPPPHSLTERRFRAAWSKSGKGHPKETENERFARVAELLRAEAEPALPLGYLNLVRKPGIKKAVAEVLKAGTRLDVRQIAEAVGDRIPDVHPKQVGEALKQLQKAPPEGYALDARHSGRTHKYRLVPRKKAPAAPVASLEAAGEAAAVSLPLVKECIEILRQPETRRQTTLALEHLWRVQKALEGLLVPEGVV